MVLVLYLVIFHANFVHLRTRAGSGFRFPRYPVNVNAIPFEKEIIKCFAYALLTDPAADKTLFKKNTTHSLHINVYNSVSFRYNTCEITQNVHY